MTKTVAHPWQFKTRFRRHAFGWKSQPAIARIKEAVSEIKVVARFNPALGGEGAVLFLERISPALENIDSSSGAIGTAVLRAMDDLVPIIAAAPVATKTRAAWLERLWQAHMDDDIPYIETLGEHWGDLCASAEMAAIWADRLAGTLEMAWSTDPALRGTFKGTMACFSALLAAGRFDQVLALVDKAPFLWWYWRRWGVRALAAQGMTDAAIRYAEGSLGFNDTLMSIACECEAMLLAAGRLDEAYRNHAILATQAGTNLATFRALAKKYPHLPRAAILADLIASTPGDEGKWFATAKELKLFDVALDLARRSPCDPKTLTRAARDFAVDQPQFAVEAGVAALDWLAQGYGYDVTSADVWAAYRSTMEAAELQGESAAVKTRLRAMVAAAPPGSLVQSLRRELAM